jgi:hypothetical protein
VRSKPLAEALKVWAETSLAQVPGRSELAKALRYILARWPALMRAFDDGRLALDNNAAEGALRSVAVRRKNFLFAGSALGAERAAAFYTDTHEITSECARSLEEKHIILYNIRNIYYIISLIIVLIRWYFVRSVMSKQINSKQNELKRLKEFAAAGVSHFIRTQFDKLNNNPPEYQVAANHDSDQSQADSNMYNAFRQRTVQINIDRIDRIDVEERNVRFRLAVEQSTFGRNHAAEFARLLQKHNSAFNEMLNSEWQSQYQKQLTTINNVNIV